MSDDWRVKVTVAGHREAVELGDALEHGDVAHRLAAAPAGRVIVSVDDSELFLYAATREQAELAAQAVGDEAGKRSLTAQTDVTHWHPGSESWQAPDVALPETAAAEAAEHAALIAGEQDELRALRLSRVGGSRQAASPTPTRSRWRQRCASAGSRACGGGATSWSAPPTRTRQLRLPTRSARSHPPAPAWRSRRRSGRCGKRPRRTRSPSSAASEAEPQTVKTILPCTSPASIASNPARASLRGNVRSMTGRMSR